ncbi:MAG: xanthine dehydrogenase accessory protein XdhC [Siculibacillus sp.]|nr:xanthine dehydrogenase accessory protein XdhC [Siculibacillus sp.]
MSGHWGRVAGILADHGRAARIAVVATRGSTPREIGAALVMRPDGGFHGTIGGGAFEWRLLARAGARLRDGAVGIAFEEVVLGPDLGQCCGGRLTVAIEVLDRDDLVEARRFAGLEAAGRFTLLGEVRDGRLHRRVSDDPALDPGLGLDGRLVERFGDDRRHLLLFGAGHVGRALVLALAPLPFRVAWIDGRPDTFPLAHPANVTRHAPADPVTMVATAPPAAFVLAMTHDHALDFAIVDACLRRADLGFVGVIGSQTKRARFASRLTEIGHTSAATRRMVCPVGAAGPRSKVPAVIAASITVELLVADEVARNTHGGTRIAAGERGVREERA